MPLTPAPVIFTCLLADVGVNTPSVLLAPPASALKLVTGILLIAVFTTPAVTNLFASLVLETDPAKLGVIVTAPLVVDTLNALVLPLDTD